MVTAQAMCVYNHRVCSERALFLRISEIYICDMETGRAVYGLNIFTVFHPSLRSEVFRLLPFWQEIKGALIRLLQGCSFLRCHTALQPRSIPPEGHRWNAVVFVVPGRSHTYGSLHDLSSTHHFMRRFMLRGTGSEQKANCSHMACSLAEHVGVLCCCPAWSVRPSPHPPLCMPGAKWVRPLLMSSNR